MKITLSLFAKAKKVFPLLYKVLASVSSNDMALLYSNKDCYNSPI